MRTQGSTSTALRKLARMENDRVVSLSGIAFVNTSRFAEQDTASVMYLQLTVKAATMRRKVGCPPQSGCHAIS